MVRILAAHSDFYIVNKPVGLAVNDNIDHDGHRTPGILAQLHSDTQASSLHPVHRLDKDTSGLLIVARNAEANAVFSRAFQEQRVKKIYIAIVSYAQGKSPKKKQGWIKGDMKRARKGSWCLTQTRENPAMTYFESARLSERKRVCVLYPKTGKTHQLRVAMQALSMPIVGDNRYGGEPSDRMYLHAYSLRFDYQSCSYTYSLSPNDGRLFQHRSYRAAENTMLSRV